MGRPRRLPVTAGRCAVRATGMLGRLAIRARFVGTPRSVLGRGIAGVLFDLGCPVGGHTTGRRSADAGPAYRRGVAGVARPRFLERHAGGRCMHGKSQGLVRAGGLRSVQLARSAATPRRIRDSKRAGRDIALGPGRAGGVWGASLAMGPGLCGGHVSRPSVDQRTAAHCALAGLPRGAGGCGWLVLAARREARSRALDRVDGYLMRRGGRRLADSFRATISSFCHWLCWPRRVACRCSAAGVRSR